MTVSARHVLLSLCMTAASVWAQPVDTATQPTPPQTAPAPDRIKISTKPRVPASRLDTFLPAVDAPFLDPVWPDRVMHAGKRSVIRSFNISSSRLFCSSGFFNSLLSSGIDSAESKLAKEQDAADLEALRAGLGLAPTDSITPEGENATPIRIRPDSPNRRARSNATGEPDSVQTFGVLSLHPTSPDQPNQDPALCRTGFALYSPLSLTPTSPAQPKRLIVLMPGMFGTPEQIIDPLVKHLRQNDCVVLRMLSQPSRFTELVQFKIDTGDHADTAAQAIRAAAVIDNRLAEVAYSVEAALVHSYSLDASLEKLPHLIMGISGGAISLPPVVARSPQRWAGAIIMGGSADFWLTLSRSNYNDFIGAVQTTWLPPEIDSASGADARRAFDGAYLSHASLDPYHTIRFLKEKPVLFIQGALDRAVPSPLGDVLWSRLGEPAAPSERWKTPLSHETLFLTLPARFPEIIGWMERAIPVPAQ